MIFNEAYLLSRMFHLTTTQLYYIINQTYILYTSILQPYTSLAGLADKDSDPVIVKYNVVYKKYMNYDGLSYKFMAYNKKSLSSEF